ncbi:hypothetical protein PMIN04_003306 [Paraphaeosphaeria minitans]
MLPPYFLVVQLYRYFNDLIRIIKMVTITKTLVAAIAISAVQALPQAATTLATVATPSSAASTPAVAAPSPDPEVQAALFRDLFSAPTAIKRFQRLLTMKGQELLSGDALRNMIVFDFNNATPAKGALGGATKAAVSIPFFFIPLRLMLTLLNRTLRPSLSSPAWVSRPRLASLTRMASTPRMFTPALPSSSP